MKHTYILAPDMNYPPGGLIDLGMIWTKPDYPGSCISRSGALAFPGDMKPQDGWKQTWSADRIRENTGMVGIWARFLQSVGIDAEVSISGGHANIDDLKFKRLETKFIDPTPSYVVNSVKRPEVAEQIRVRNYGTHAYMVTGIMVAVNAAAKLKNNRTAAGKMSFGVDGTPAGAPAAAGPKTAFKSTNFQKTSFEDSSDFVFAYRLSEIYYRKGKPKHRLYNKGAAYSASSENDEPGEKESLAAEVEEVDIEVDPLEDDDDLDLDNETWCRETFAAEGGDETYDFLLPTLRI